MSRSAFFLALACWSTFAADLPRRNIEITLERANEGGWTSVSPRTVFNAKDEIRFRLRANLSGYLYVLNQTSDGSYLWLFPTKATGVENHIEANRNYQIPANEGAFQIPPTPGYDTVFWIMSEEPLRELPELPNPIAPNPAALLPRCRGELRARGPCEDEQAGPKTLANPELLPRQLIPPQNANSDIRIKQTQGRSVITLPGAVPFFGYQFVIAHR